MRLPVRSHARAGFTMAELAVTMLIVFGVLIALLEGLNRAKITAAHSRNAKVATQLAMQTLGQVDGGLLADELEGGGFTGSYADEGYDPDTWWYEVVLGDETFLEIAGEETEYFDRPFDSFDPDPYDDDEDRAEEDLPFEKVKVRVHFPDMPHVNFKTHVTLERWIPWDQVYGPSEEDLAAEEDTQ